MKKNHLALVSKQNKGMIFVYLLCGICVVFLQTYSIKYFEKIINNFNNGDITLFNIIFYGIIMLITCIISYLDTYPSNYLINKIYYDFKRLSITKMEKIDYASYLHLGLGKSTQLIETGARAGKDILLDYYFRLIREILPTIFFSLFFISTIDLKIMLIVVVSYIVVFLFTKLLLKKLYSMRENLDTDMEKYNKNFVRNIMEMVVFRINGRYKKELQKIDNISNNIIKTKCNIRMIHESFFTIFESIVVIIKILILLYALFLSRLQIGALVVLISLVGNAYQPIAIFNVIYVEYKLNKISYLKYEDFLNIKDDKNIISGNKFIISSPNIKFDNVSFSYDNKQIISNLSFDIKPYSNVAFVGNSGSGKSTIIKLILGFIKTNNGKIFISNQNIADLDLNSLYPYFSYISQDSPIFDGTLRENLIFDKKINDEEIIKVLDKVDLIDFYKKLPNGLDTFVGEKGILMSGGERQRVAIARMFFSNTPFMLFDEATSALDNITEKKIIDEIMNLNGSTKIFVAHRLSTIKNVDNIFVLNNEGICENGNFETLLNNKSYFYALYKASKEKDKKEL